MLSVTQAKVKEKMKTIRAYLVFTVGAKPKSLSRHFDFVAGQGGSLGNLI